MKGGWRCASTMPGGQCVMILGIVLMLLWSAGSQNLQSLDVSHPYCTSCPALLGLVSRPLLSIITLHVPTYHTSYSMKCHNAVQSSVATSQHSIVQSNCQLPKLFPSPAGVALLNAHFGQGTGQIVLDDVQCSGGENQLLACISSPILTVSSNCDHSDDAGVRCKGT